MTDRPTQPLRGDAAWRAQLKEIARRNEAARSAGMSQRAAKEAALQREASARARSEMEHLRDH
jgi:hypothetical protein